MSQWRGQISDIEEPSDVAEFVGAYYHIPTLLVVVGFMVWTRVRNWREFFVDGTVFFSGNDAWYHYRMTSYTVRHWPETSPFDPWTGFPTGAHSSQFGTVMDQIVATAALVVGLGSPSDHTIRVVALFAPVVFGIAVTVPTYLIAKRATGRFGGVLAVGTLALTGTQFARRSSVGFFDHHVAEVLFMTTAVLATMVAVSVAQREKPVWELFEARDAAALRRPVGISMIAGFAVALYIWTWPPGVFLLGILGTYYLIEISSQVAHGESPEHVAVAGGVSMATAGVLLFAPLENAGISATSFSLVQPLLALTVAVGCVFLAWLAREWDERELSNVAYPVTVGGILLAVAGLTAVVLPDIFGFFLNQTTRVVGLSVTDTAATVAEATPMPFGELFPKYGFTIFIAILGVVYLFARQLFDRPRSELTLLAVWMTFMLFATLTQNRFDYYLAVTTAVMTGYVIGEFVDYADLFGTDTEIETYQVLTIVAVLLVVVAPLIYPGSIALGYTNNSPDASVQWSGSLDWMDDSTPEEGNLEGAGNDMEYYGTFQNTDDYEYEDGFYGVLSWWDYGHWITTMGERIPIANPFQQGASNAANFLLSANESAANDVISELNDGNGTETRYVMADWKMVDTATSIRGPGGSSRLEGKYFAPFQFYDAGTISPNDYYSASPQSKIYYQVQNTFRTFNLHSQAYYNSTVVRLYRYHGSAVEPSPVVTDWTIDNQRNIRMSNGTRSFDSMAAAREYVRNDPTSQIGGIGPYPEERVPAMEHYRMVHGSNATATDSRDYLLAREKVAGGAFNTRASVRGQPIPQVIDTLQYNEHNWVKTFERVDGATIEGEGPANRTVRASVEMEVPSTNSTFTYRAQAQTGPDGEFSLTVPYSTTGYDEYSAEDGYTEPSVRATGPYELRTGATFDGNSSLVAYNASVDVTEGQVVGEDTGPIEVTLDEQVLGSVGGSENGTDGSAGGTSSGSDDTTTGTGDDSTSGSGDATATPTDGNGSTGEALAPPQLPGTAALIPLVGAGLLSLVGLTRRN